MSVQILETKEIILGEDDDLIVDVHDAEGNSLAAMTGTLGIVSSAGATTLAAGTAMTSSAHPTGGTSYRRLTYTLTSGAGQTITAVGEYMATYIATLGSKNYYFVQAIRVVAAPSLSIGWPDVDDVVTRLEEMGLTAPSNRTVKQAIDGAIEAWERATGYAPFLAAGADTTWYFEPNGTNIIDFGQDNGPGGFVAVTSITTDVTYGNATGNLRVSGRDYQLKPANATNKGEPFTYVVSKWTLIDIGEATVKVIGDAGYCETLPADIWEGILRAITAAMLIPQTISLSGGLESWSEADVKESWGKESPLMLAASYYEQKEQILLMRYRRVRIG